MGRITSSLKKSNIDNFVFSLTSNNSNYYTFAARNVVPANTTALDNTIYDTVASPSLQLLFGKKIKSSDVMPVIRNVIWTANTVYDRYNNKEQITDKNYYVIAQPDTVGGYYHIFKCIDNNDGAPSLLKPDQLQLNVFTKSDGYKWKYMTSVSDAVYKKFASTSYFPVYANNTITNGSAQVSGIDVINIESSGNSYITTANGIIESVISPTLLQIGDDASSDNNFYNKSSIYIYNDINQTGQLLEIAGYVANNSGRWVTTASSSNTTSITPGLTKYIISPTVRIDGDYVTPAKAYSIVSNTAISDIVIIDHGSGYTHANVSIIANTYYGTGASVTAIVPPIGGHGFDVVNELDVKGMSIAVSFANSESNTIPVNCSYSSYGIIKNPKTFANNQLDFTSNTFTQILKANTTGQAFTVGESVRGSTSGALGYVVFSNTSVVHLSGDKKFSNGEIIIGSNSNISSTINISNYGDLDQKILDVLYINNIPKIDRNANQSESFKIIIQI